MILNGSLIRNNRSKKKLNSLPTYGILETILFRKASNTDAFSLVPQTLFQFVSIYIIRMAAEIKTNKHENEEIKKSIKTVSKWLNNSANEKIKKKKVIVWDSVLCHGFVDFNKAMY